MEIRSVATNCYAYRTKILSDGSMSLLKTQVPVRVGETVMHNGAPLKVVNVVYFEDEMHLELG